MNIGFIALKVGNLSVKLIYEGNVEFVFDGFEGGIK